MPNPFAVSRQLAEAGIEPKKAEAIVEMLVLRAEFRPLSKLELAKAKAELEANIAKIVKAEVQAAFARLDNK